MASHRQLDDLLNGRCSCRQFVHIGVYACWLKVEPLLQASNVTKLCDDDQQVEMRYLCTLAFAADALNEFEEETAAGNADVASATSRAVAASASVHSGAGLGAGTVGTTSDDTMRETVNRMMRDVQDPDFQRALEQTIREMGTGAGASTAGGLSNGGADAAMSADLFRSLATESGAQGAEGIAKTLEILQKLSLEADNMGAGGIPGSGVSSGSAAAAEDLSDEVIQRMMGEFEAMGQKVRMMLFLLPCVHARTVEKMIMLTLYAFA